MAKPTLADMARVANRKPSKPMKNKFLLDLRAGKSYKDALRNR